MSEEVHDEKSSNYFSNKKLAFLVTIIGALANCSASNKISSADQKALKKVASPQFNIDQLHRVIPEKMLLETMELLLSLRQAMSRLPNSIESDRQDILRGIRAGLTKVEKNIEPLAKAGIYTRSMILDVEEIKASLTSL